MPEYAVLMYHPRPGKGEPTDRAPHDAYARSMETSGELVFARGLADPRQARSLRADGATEGPYLESAEAVVGVYVVEAPDLDAAVAIASRNPILRQGGGVEVRPVG